MSYQERELTVPAGQWQGPPPGGELCLYVTGVMAGISPGWVTVTGWRYLPGALSREMHTVQVLVTAMPVHLLPATPSGAW